MDKPVITRRDERGMAVSSVSVGLHLWFAFFMPGLLPPSRHRWNRTGGRTRLAPVRRSAWGRARLPGDPPHRQRRRGGVRRPRLRPRRRDGRNRDGRAKSRHGTAMPAAPRRPSGTGPASGDHTQIPADATVLSRRAASSLSAGPLAGEQVRLTDATSALTAECLGGRRTMPRESNEVAGETEGWAPPPRAFVGRPPRALTPDISLRHRFGAELRRWRMDRGLTHQRLGALLWRSAASVAKVEKGERWPTLEFTVACERVLVAGGALLALWPDVEAQRLASDGRRSRHRTGRSRRPAEPGVD